MAAERAAPATAAVGDGPSSAGFVRGLGLFNGTLLVAGNMVGSGIFIVSADIARQVGSPGWLLIVWLCAGFMTLAAALAYGELAAMFPRAGGQYVYLREAFGPLWAFLYGWALFLVIQTGTVAAVSIAFARFLGVLWPAIAADRLLLDGGLLPVPGIGHLALSLSTQQAAAIVATLVLTAVNLRGLRAGRLVQDVFTCAKIGAVLALVGIGLASWGEHPGSAIASADFWRAPPTADGGALLVLLGTALVGALFSADAWNNVGFTSEEMHRPERNLPLSMALGVGLVIALYLAVNLVYLVALPMEGIAGAPEDRVGVAAARVLVGDVGEAVMALAILVATFGCMNGMILAGARVYYTLSRDGLFFAAAGRLNRRGVPGMALLLQGAWVVVLTLPRTFDPSSGRYGNLYGNLLDYIIFGVLVFYVLTVTSVFVLRRRHPDHPRPVRAIGYPLLPALYVLAASGVCAALLVAESTRINALLGLAVIASGLPVYFAWRRPPA